MSQSGTVLDPAGIEIAARAGFNETAPSVAFDGTNFLVVWEEVPCHRILGRRVSQEGVPDGDGSFLISYCEEPGEKLGVSKMDPAGKRWIRKFDPAVAFDGVNYLVTWVDFYGDFGGYYSNIVGARVTPDRSVLGELGVTSDGFYQSRGSPSLVFGGSTYLVAWIDAQVLRGSRVTREGSVLDPRTGSRCPRPGSLSRRRLRRHELPRVWDNNVDVVGNRVTQAGGLLDGNGFLITRNGPAAASPAAATPLRCSDLDPL